MSASLGFILLSWHHLKQWCMPAPAEDIMLYAMEHSYSSAGEIKRQTRIGNSQKNKKYMCVYISVTAQRPVRTDVMGKAVPSPHTLLSRDSCLAGRAMPTERGQPLLRWVRVGRAGMSPLQWACPRDPRAGSAWTRGPPRPLPHGQEEILPWRPLAGTGGHPGQIREGAARHRHG